LLTLSCCRTSFLGTYALTPCTPSWQFLIIHVHALASLVSIPFEGSTIFSDSPSSSWIFVLEDIMLLLFPWILSCCFASSLPSQLFLVSLLPFRLFLALQLMAPRRSRASALAARIEASATSSCTLTCLSCRRRHIRCIRSSISSRCAGCVRSNYRCVTDSTARDPFLSTVRADICRLRASLLAFDRLIESTVLIAQPLLRLLGLPLLTLVP
jgi:hypothetical protein